MGCQYFLLFILLRVPVVVRKTVGLRSPPLPTSALLHVLLCPIQAITGRTHTKELCPVFSSDTSRSPGTWDPSRMASDVGPRAGTPKCATLAY